MKKFLLFAAVAMMAMTANAQKADRSMSLSKQLSAFKVSDGSMSIAIKENAKKFAPAKAITGDIELISAETSEAEDDTEYIETSSVIISPTTEKVTYNEQQYIKAETPLGNREGCLWTALVKEDLSQIVIPVNQEYNDPEYGLIYMWGLIQKEDGVYYDDENDIVYSLNPETGKYECDNVGWAMKMTGDYEQYVWTSSWYAEWMQPNGVETGSYAAPSSSWAEYSNPIFVEDLGDEINIWNFFGMTKLNILLDEETGNLLIPMGQPVTTTSSNADKDVYGYFINVVGTRLEGSSIYRDWDKEYTEAYFAVTENREEGNFIVSANNNILTDPNDGYMSLASNPDAEGAAWGMGWLHAVNFTLNEGVYKSATDGIKDINANVKSNGRVYNLAGQQVAKNVKGIVIVDGKKIVK